MLLSGSRNTRLAETQKQLMAFIHERLEATRKSGDEWSTNLKSGFRRTNILPTNRIRVDFTDGALPSPARPLRLSKANHLRKHTSGKPARAIYSA